MQKEALNPAKHIHITAKVVGRPNQKKVIYQLRAPTGKAVKLKKRTAAKDVNQNRLRVVRPSNIQRELMDVKGQIRSGSLKTRDGKTVKYKVTPPLVASRRGERMLRAEDAAYLDLSRGAAAAVRKGDKIRGKAIRTHAVIPPPHIKSVRFEAERGFDRKVRKRVPAAAAPSKDSTSKNRTRKAKVRGVDVPASTSPGGLMDNALMAALVGAAAPVALEAGLARMTRRRPGISIPLLLGGSGLGLLAAKAISDEKDGYADMLPPLPSKADRMELTKMASADYYLVITGEHEKVAASPFRFLRGLRSNLRPPMRLLDGRGAMQEARIGGYQRPWGTAQRHSHTTMQHGAPTQASFDEFLEPSGGSLGVGAVRSLAGTAPMGPARSFLTALEARANRAIRSAAARPLADAPLRVSPGTAGGIAGAGGAGLLAELRTGLNNSRLGRAVNEAPYRLAERAIWGGAGRPILTRSSARQALNESRLGRMVNESRAGQAFDRGILSRLDPVGLRTMNLSPASAPPRGAHLPAAPTSAQRRHSAWLELRSRGGPRYLVDNGTVNRLPGDARGQASREYRNQMASRSASRAATFRVPTGNALIANAALAAPGAAGRFIAEKTAPHRRNFMDRLRAEMMDGSLVHQARAQIRNYGAGRGGRIHLSTRGYSPAEIDAARTYLERRGIQSNLGPKVVQASAEKVAYLGVGALGAGLGAAGMRFAKRRGMFNMAADEAFKWSGAWPGALAGAAAMGLGKAGYRAFQRGIARRRMINTAKDWLPVAGAAGAGYALTR